MPIHLPRCYGLAISVFFQIRAASYLSLHLHSKNRRKSFEIEGFFCSNRRFELEGIFTGFQREQIGRWRKS
ncbi:hypothetical protein L1987_45492 [Smallanthus sonchifolius]|uniref:Uncharacterized protein n=1 Tax=Smallanthus sonchifolius TaxID=185202 RepID=A0ACB9FX80_9ASTR|nr:hypothetical protein L1987_45492 [Smallanthus sonchifolius]